MKHRALTEENKWVYGNLLYFGDIPLIQEDNEKMQFTKCVKGTEGMYSGLNTEDSDMIYQGDRLEVYEVANIFNSVIVEFRESAFYVNTDLLSDFLLDTEFSIRVSKNIHQNPEIIKQ